MIDKLLEFGPIKNLYRSFEKWETKYAWRSDVIRDRGVDPNIVDVDIDRDPEMIYEMSDADYGGLYGSGGISYNIGSIESHNADYKEVLACMTMVELHELTHWAENGLTEDKDHSGRWMSMLLPVCELSLEKRLDFYPCFGNIEREFDPIGSPIYEIVRVGDLSPPPTRSDFDE